MKIGDSDSIEKIETIKAATSRKVTKIKAQIRAVHETIVSQQQVILDKLKFISERTHR